MAEPTSTEPTSTEHTPLLGNENENENNANDDPPSRTKRAASWLAKNAVCADWTLWVMAELLNLTIGNHIRELADSCGNCHSMHLFRR